MARFGAGRKKRRLVKTNQPQFQFSVRTKMWLVFVLLFQLVISSAGAAGCEKEGPCEVDHYCGRQRNVCRSCGDIASHYCHNRTIILERFPECDAFCYKQKLEAAATELIVKDGVIQNQTDLIKRFDQIVTSIDPACGKGLDQLHYALISLCCVLLLVVCVTTWMLVRLSQRKALACRRSPNTKMPAEMGELLQTETFTDSSASPPADEEGYGTGHSTNSTPLPVRASTSAPDPEAQSIQPCPLVVCEIGRNGFIPTTDDKGPPEYAL